MYPITTNVVHVYIRLQFTREELPFYRFSLASSFSFMHGGACGVIIIIIIAVSTGDAAVVVVACFTGGCIACYRCNVV